MDGKFFLLIKSSFIFVFCFYKSHPEIWNWYVAISLIPITDNRHQFRKQNTEIGEVWRSIGEKHILKKKMGEVFPFMDAGEM